MAFSEEQLQSLVKSAEERESIARRRAALYSLIPIVLASLLLWFTGWQIKQANQELTTAKNELQSSLQEQAATNMQLEQTRQEFEQTRQELETANSQLGQTQQELEAANSQLEQTQQELEAAKNQLEHTQQEVDELEQRVDELSKTLEEATEHFRQAMTFRQYEYHIDELSLKSLAGGLFSFTMSDLLFDILFMQRDGVGWKLNGVSPDEGFDSPSFAAYMLQEHFLPGISDERYRLDEVLPSGDRPRVGSVAFYERGYTMFYFEDIDNTPFVIGMTPLGIIALKDDFAPVRGYGYFY